MRNISCRHWLITIGRVKTSHIDHTVIKKWISNLSGGSIDYWCMCDECWKAGPSCERVFTYHTHLYLFRKNYISREDILDCGFRDNRDVELLPLACYDDPFGASRNYIRKEGEYACQLEDEINFQETFEEFGTPPAPDSIYNS